MIPLWFLLLIRISNLSPFSPIPIDLSSFENEVIETNEVFNISGIGNGYSSPAIYNQIIYVTGEIESLGYLFAFDMNGKLEWKSCYGKEWSDNYRGSRAAPVIDNDFIYVCSGIGILSCFELYSGKQKWQIDLVNDLDGSNVVYGYSMPVIIHQNLLICSPGGMKNNVVALDKTSGEMVWSCKGNGETAGYGAPSIINWKQRNILMTFSEFTFMGIDVSDGKLLWTYDLNFKGELPCNKPLYKDGVIYIVAGPGNGATALKLSSNGKLISKKWNNLDLNTAFGNFEIFENKLIGSSGHKHSYLAVDIRNGKINSELKFGNGSLIAWNGSFIAYTHNGKIGFLKIINDDLHLTGQFKVHSGTGEHFAIPVIHDNLLFIRHGNHLMCYELNFQVV